jgi:hypothetical protein
MKAIKLPKQRKEKINEKKILRQRKENNDECTNEIKTETNETSTRKYSSNS